MSDLRVTDYGVYVKRTPIHGTDRKGERAVVYSAWEPSEDHGHSTITTIDGVWFGRIGTRRFACNLPAGSDERHTAVMAEYEEQYLEAYNAIADVFPLACGREDMGEVETREPIAPRKEAKSMTSATERS